MIEQYSYYKFKIEETQWVYTYRIYGEGCYPYDDGEIESDEGYDTEDEARIAAQDHIDKLENGGDRDPDYDYCAPTIDWNERRLLGE